MQERRQGKNSSRQIRYDPLASNSSKSRANKQDLLSSSLSESIMKQAKEQREEDSEEEDDAYLEDEDEQDLAQVCVTSLPRVFLCILFHAYSSMNALMFRLLMKIMFIKKELKTKK